jgi:hypothetical protein
LPVILSPKGEKSQKQERFFVVSLLRMTDSNELLRSLCFLRIKQGKGLTNWFSLVFYLIILVYSKLWFIGHPGIINLYSLLKVFIAISGREGVITVIPACLLIYYGVSGLMSLLTRGI